jgi:hypothetical protein
MTWQSLILRFLLERGRSPRAVETSIIYLGAPPFEKGTLPGVIPSEVEGSRCDTVNTVTGFFDSAALRSE